MNNKVLFQAVEEGNYSVVRRILMAERAQDEFEPDHDKWQKALLVACQRGFDQIVRLLLKYKVEGFLRSDGKKTLLIHASEKGFEKIARALIKAGERQDEVDLYQRSALIHACRNGHYSIVQLLLKRGVYVHQQDSEGKNALMYACINGYDSIVRHLLKRNVNINARDNDTKTALMYVCREGHYGIAEILLQNNAYPDAWDKDRLTSMFLAYERRDMELVRLLIKFGANVSHGNGAGKSLLMLACEQGDGPMVEELLQCGASIYLRSDDGVKANLSLLHFCCINKLVTVVDVLIKHCVQRKFHREYWVEPLVSSCCRVEGDEILALFIKHGVKLDTKPSDFWTFFWRTPLMHACWSGRLAAIKLLLDRDTQLVNVNSRGGNEKTALMCACERGQRDVVEYLLKQTRQGVDVNALDRDKKSALMYACESGHDSVVSAMLEISPSITSTLNSSDNNGCTPLISACRNGHENTVKTLIGYNAVPYLCDRHKMSAIVYACKRGHLRIVQHLMNGHVGVSDAQTRKALVYACFKGRESIVEFLLKRGVDVTSASFKKGSALTIACQSGNSKIVNLLASAGCSRIDYPEDFNPLIKACRRGDERIVKFLLDQKVDVDVCDKEGKTPLMHASMMGSVSVVRILVTCGANLNACDHYKCTALSYALGNSPSSLVATLLLALQEVNVNYHFGPDRHTPLIYACKYGNENAVKQLIHRGVDLNARDLSGKSALMYACIGIHEKIVNLLLLGDVDLNAQDLIGSTALMYAWRNRCDSIIMCLLVKPALDLIACGEMGGQSILMYACKKGDEAMVRLLIDSIRDTDIRSTEWLEVNAAFLLACEKGFDKIVQLLIAKYPDICVTSLDSTKRTGLMLAYMSGRYEVVDVLIRHCPSIDFINACDSHSKTILNYVMGGLYRHIEIAFSLLRPGINVNCCGADGKTPLFYACLRGCDDLVNQLLSHDADVNTIDCDGKTPLMAACERGIDANTILKQLIDKGVDVQAEDKNGKTSLMYLCEKGLAQLVDSLLDKGAVDVNRHDKDGKTALMYAMKSWTDNSSMFCQLIQSGADVNAFDATGKSVLMCAIENRNPSRYLALLLKNGANVNGRARNNNKTALMFACKLGIRTAMSSLIRKGADINARNFLRKTPLMFACDGGHLEIVKVLIRHRANVRACNKRGQTALMLACRSGNERLVKYLIKQNSNNINSRDKLRNTTLMYACKEGLHSIMSTLIENGADMTICNSQGCSPLMHSCKTNDSKAVDLLVHHGPKVYEVDDERHEYLSYPFVTAATLGHYEALEEFMHGVDHNFYMGVLGPPPNGDTALTVACRKGHIETVDVLLQFGDDVDVPDIEDKTALMYASEKGHEKIVAMLLKHKPVIDAHDKQGRTALMKACKNSKSEIVKLLLEHGASTDLQDKDGRTAFWFCACPWDPDMVVLMLKERNSFRDDSQVYCTRYTGRLEKKVEPMKCVYLLIQHGMHIDTPDEFLSRVITCIASDFNSNDDDEDDDNFVMALDWKKMAGDLKKCLDRGACIDVVDGKGCSAFCYAMEGDGTCLRALIDSGQLVNEAGRLKSSHKKTLVDALVNRAVDPTCEALTELLKSGLFEWHICPSSLVKEIGVLGLRLGYCPGSNHAGLSPLVCAVKDNAFMISRLFLRNLYFFPEDLDALRMDKSFVDLELRVLVEISTKLQVFDLESLSFLSVSKLISQGGLPCKRAERVNALPIPALIKSKLKFEQCQDLGFKAPCFSV